MIDYLINLDESLFLTLNHLHNGFLDFVMVQASGVWIWIPLYAFLLYCIAKKRMKAFWITALCLILMVVLTDQTANLIKHSVARLRPAYNANTALQVRLLLGKGGQYGFFSAHAANTFALASFIFYFFKRNLWVGVGMFFWAFIVSYSRIYCGRHFVGDVLVGMMFGYLVGWLIYFIEHQCQNYWSHRKG